MDDTQREGSDSDWDSTLDFTSPRQGGVGQLPPRINLEIEEESALSDESDLEGEHSLPVDRQFINNALKPQENRKSRSPSPSRKENNIVLAQKQQNLQKKQTVPERKEPTSNQLAQKQDDTPPPYNFQEAVNGRITPEPATKGPPGKERKGTTYDPAPTPTPRGRPVSQGSIRSVGSWDESDADERTLRELRSKYRQEKQKEELKIKEAEKQKSVIEDAPQTARSETTWQSWAGSKFGKKPKNGKNNQQSQSSKAPARSQGQLQGQSQGQPQERSQGREVVTMATTRDASAPPIEMFDVRYESPAQPSLQLQYPPVPVYQKEEMEDFDEPKKLFVKDDDQGRYLYFFGHGNLHYYEVNEDFDEAVLPPIADKVDRIAQRLWQEIFALLRIILSFFISFFVELTRFLGRHIFRPIVLGIFVTLGDYVIKPFLSATFNGFVQPFSIFWWNVFTGMRHMFRPIGEILARVLEQFAVLFRSIRLFEVNWIARQGPVPQQHRQHNV